MKRPRVRMLVYYRGFGETGNPYALGPYPRTTNTLRLKIRRANFLSTAEYNAGTLPPLPVKAKPKKPVKPKPTPVPVPPPIPPDARILSRRRRRRARTREARDLSRASRKPLAC